MTIEDDPKEALAAYIGELERDYYPWYRRSASRHVWAWGTGQTVALVAGVLASVLAAAADQDELSRFGWVRYGLIVLPMLGAAAASLLAQTRVRELMALREGGRETIQALIAQAKVDYAAEAANPSRLSALHRALIENVSVLERAQSAGFLMVAPGASGTMPSQSAKTVAQAKT